MDKGSTSGVVFLRSILHWANESAKYHGASRHLRSSPDVQEVRLSISQMPEPPISHQLVSQLVDAYFTYYHTSYPFIHEATFRAQYSELVPKSNETAWNMLFYTILALGAWSLGQGHADLEEYFYRKASSFWHDQSIFETACLPLVQALVLISNLVQKRNKPNTGWNYLGVAVRMALSLGLHRELPEWNISLLQREMRRRIWWGLFIFDSGASVTFGRAVLLPEKAAIDVKHVLNIHDAVMDSNPKDGFG